MERFAAATEQAAEIIARYPPGYLARMRQNLTQGKLPEDAERVLADFAPVFAGVSRAASAENWTFPDFSEADTNDLPPFNGGG